MFTEYLYLPKIWARPFRYGTWLGLPPTTTTSPFTLQISSFDVFSYTLCFVSFVYPKQTFV